MVESEYIPVAVNGSVAPVPTVPLSSSVTAMPVSVGPLTVTVAVKAFPLVSFAVTVTAPPSGVGGVAERPVVFPLLSMDK